MGLLKWLGLDGGCEKDPVELTDDNFKEEVLQSRTPVLVDVWSDGCGPCRALAPTIMKLACKYEGRVKVAQLNVSAAPRTLRGLGVRGTPTVLFFQDGRVVESVVGMRGQIYYEEIIETDLLSEGKPEAAESAG
jgi:thioredoxin 1